MEEAQREVDVTAELHVRIPRDGTADLEGGIEEVLDRTEVVESIDSLDVTGITPGLNDIKTDAIARLTLAVARPEAAAVREKLEEELAIEAEIVGLDRPHPTEP